MWTQIPIVRGQTIGIGEIFASLDAKITSVCVAQLRMFSWLVFQAPGAPVLFVL